MEDEHAVKATRRGYAELRMTFARGALGQCRW